MKKNKIKYFGLCAASLLTLAPVLGSVVSAVSQPIQSNTVKAANDALYQSSLNAAFNDSVNLTTTQIKNIQASDITGTFQTDGSMFYSNVAATGSRLFNSSSISGTSLLRDNLQDPFLKLFVQTNALVGVLPHEGYKTTVKVTSSSFSTPTSRDDLLLKLKNLSVDNKFTVTISTLDSSNNVVADTKTITVTVTRDTSSLIKINPISATTAALTDLTSPREVAADIAPLIKDTNGSQVFDAASITGAYYYALNGSSNYKKSSATSRYTDFYTGNVGAVINQLISVPYTAAIANKYDANNFVFLNLSEDKNTGTVAAAPATGSDTTTAYVVRKIVIGSPVYPVFRYTTTDSNNISVTNTINSGDTLKPNPVDTANLTYIYNNQTSMNTLTSYLNNKFNTSNNGAGNFSAYPESKNGSIVGAALTVKYSMPVLNPATTPQYILATALNSTTGAESVVKIPVTITGIPNSLVAPTVTKFPDTTSVNSKSTSKYDPMTGVAATYVGSDGKTHDLTKANVTITVKDAKGNNVNLNSDGTVATTTPGIYTIHYVFANPDDTTRTVAKDLTLNVTNSDLVAPTVTGFYENSTYTLSNNRQSEVSPYATVLRMDKVSASYIGADGASHAIDRSKVAVAVKNSRGQAVNLNSAGNISMTTPDTYTVTYTWTNPDDTTKTISKSLTLIINRTISQPITAKYVGNEIANPTIDTNTTNFNVLNNVSFNLVYTDPSTSTPTTPITETVPNNFVSVTVSKNGVDVPLTNNSFAPTEGVYTISYSVVNPRDNATVLTYTRTLTVTKAVPKPVEPTITQEHGIVYIKYVWGYGINLWKNHTVTDGAERNADGSLRKLITGTGWKYSAIATYPDGTKWYRLGKDQWIPAQYTSLDPVVDPNSWTITLQQGIGIVNYVPGYSINVWTSPDQKSWTKRLRHGTGWKYFKVATKGGSTMYNLGGDQWVDALFFSPIPR
ncbi:hypothetical protein [Xylocopilactobacillus apis]|uniref:Uncharacterized protein n=1 Tax=Xylocopilactobacillus apis TaxID=2932183 RepID=A0AAU9CSM9_9LACO|nr:hypothetical protein [Xylocopilactobacillus apis]BDR56999.1 hypothetical protein KIMC2_15610 [Xylocopilactobacillus apis]